MDRDKATELIVKAAELGDPRAQYIVALWYAKYEGHAFENDLIQKDSQKEAELWRSAADTTGHPTANYQLGMMLLNGEGVDRDAMAALRYLEDAAEQGVMGAAFEVGSLYLFNEGIKDYRKAFRWFLHVVKAREKKLRLMAFSRLARMYWRGRGISKDETMAIELWHTAADDPQDGDPVARLELGMIYGRQQQYDMAMKYLLQLEEMPPYAHLLVGEVLHVGLGSFRQDRQRALTHIEVAAEHGISDALCILGSYYRDGEGVPKDSQKAYELFAKAAEQGHLISMHEMALLICNGRMGTPIDWRKAGELSHWVFTQNSGDPYAAYTTGVMYSEGSGVPEDHARAVSLLRKATAGPIDARATERIRLLCQLKLN